MSSTEIDSVVSDVAPPVAAPAAPASSLWSIALVTGLTFLQLVLQFATQLLLAKYFGAAGEMDAYVTALAPPVVIATILSGSIGYVLVPAVAQELATSGPRSAAAVASQVGLYLLISSGAITLVVAATASHLSRVLCPGFLPQERLLTTQLLRVSALLILANSLITYLNALAHCYRHFARPAVAGMIGTLATLVYVIIFHQRHGIFAVMWGVVLGAAITCAILLPLFVQKARESAVWKLPPLPSTRRCLWLLAPIVLAALYWRLDPLLDRYLSSALPTGNIAHLGYAWRLVSGLSLIGTSGLSIVAFPAIAAHTAAGERSKVCAELSQAIRLLLFLVAPVCVGLVSFAAPLVRLLYERGQFVAADTEAVSLLVVLYVGVIVGTGLGDLLSRTFYAMHDVRVPALINMGAFTAAAAIKILVVPSWGVAGLVAATSFYYLLNAWLLGRILVGKLSPGLFAGVGEELSRSLASALVACGVAAAVIRLPIGSAVLPAAICGAVVYVVVMWLLGDEFARKIEQRLFGRLRSDLR